MLLVNKNETTNMRSGLRASHEGTRLLFAGTISPSMTLECFGKKK